MAHHNGGSQQVELTLQADVVLLSTVFFAAVRLRRYTKKC